ncbi:unnamed protein product [Phyllotreta striolata]|uniref:Uncharacterized protein n=1 Tax=Phyllotreta striolata TaxID=444603 RepID=A0A9N9TEN3_PHYSR|nr:unnamed protein product [Phyllotreta striolata]
MKVLILVLAYAFLGAEASSSRHQWKQFKSNFGVRYENLAEERHRYQIFQDNLRKIEEHNARYQLGLETYYMGWIKVKVTMKVLILVLAYAFLGAEASSSRHQWKQFKSNFGVRYENLAEERHRYQIFQDNLRKIEEHNARYQLGLETYYMGVNQFSDMTQREFGQMLRGKGVAALNRTPAARPARRLHKQGRDDFDWEDKGAVLDVGDQGDCQAGWAFSATGALEGLSIIKMGFGYQLSAQQLVDCAVPEGGSCADGDIETAFKYVIANGLTRQADYPYTGVKGKCNATKESFVTAKTIVKGINTEDDLERAMFSHGPVSAYIDGEPLHQYQGGVFQSKACSMNETRLTHGVLVVGYGFDDSIDMVFWNVKNSWGENWGEQGYVKILKNTNMCGIGKKALFPNL